jgi:hypothetical protein
MKKRRKNIQIKLGLIFITLLFVLATTSISNALWYDYLHLDISVQTGEWDYPCICVRKIIDGSYTDPVTGEDLNVPNYKLNLIHQSDREDPGFPTKFKLKIEVENSCGEDFNCVKVTDKIGNLVAPRSIITITHGGVIFIPYGFNRQEFGHDYMVWYIGILPAEETAILEIWIETLKNKPGFYEPTSEDQEIVINDRGAKVKAITSEGEIIYAETVGVTLDIDPYGTPEDHLAIIGAPQLPYATPWACNDNSPC